MAKDVVDSMRAEVRAVGLNQRQEIRDWIAEFENVVKRMPRQVMVYVASGRPVILALGEQGERYMTKSGGADSMSEVDRVSGGQWDGGDW